VTRTEMDDKEWAEKMASLTVAQIQERFHKLFKREMTAKERIAFFLPDGD